MNTFNPFILEVNGNCRDVVNAIIIDDLLITGHRLGIKLLARPLANTGRSWLLLPKRHSEIACIPY